MMVENVGRRRVLLAAPRGFCAGVQRAVRAVEEAIEAYGGPVYVRRQIVHNAHVVAALERRGAIFVAEAEEAPEGAVLVLAAHGVAPRVHDVARARGLRVIDATCPLVTKIHREVRRFADSGFSVVLIGQRSHEEMVGTYGQAPDKVVVVSEPKDISLISVPDDERVAWVSQSTLAVEYVDHMVRLLRQRFPALIDPPSEDICYAVSNRQAAVRAIAPKSDLVLVAGARNSHNSTQLVRVALAAGARMAQLVEAADHIAPSWLADVSTVGVTGGASAPASLIDAVIARLAEHGYTAVEEVVSGVESQSFARPRGFEVAR
jgi:4-hydroxy-3-methylbut-2-enyl diphosphate reductase